MSETDATARYDAASDWYADLARARATTVVELGAQAWGMLTPEFPNSFVHNAILLRADPGPDRLVTWADEILGGAGLDHRHVVARCDLTQATRDALATSGYELQPEIVMGRAAAEGPLPQPPGVVVEEVEPEEVGAFEERMWRTEWLPGIGDDELRDLLARRGSNTRSGPYVSFVVHDGADVVASADLAVRGDAAELDGVATWASYRGRGYGDALVAACVRESARRGCEWLYLEALEDDWPKDWYARRSFAALGPCWSATRREGGA